MRSCSTFDVAIASCKRLLLPCCPHFLLFLGNLRVVTVVLDKYFGENERKEERTVETQEN